MTSAQDDWEFISFLDAQTNPALLNPIDDQLSDAMSSQLELEKEEQDGTTTNGHAREVEVIYGKQREEEVILIAQAEGSIISNGRKKKHLDPAIEARDREREREKEARRLQREEIEKKAIILKAIQNNSTIEKQKARLEREAKLCSDWTAGRSGAEAIGRQINGLWQSSRPTDREVAQRDALITDAEECINKKWPGCGLRLIPFGSTRTGLIEPRSDIDLTLFDPLRPFGVGTPKSELEKPLEGASNGFLLDSISMYGVSQLPDYYSVNLIANALRRHGKDARGRDKFIKVVPISKARVPIVKFVSSTTGLSSDINVNDGFGNVNSEMIAAYCEVDPELIRPLLYAIKKWASRRGINDPAGKSGPCSLNSYTICLIAIQFLQIQGIVPNLQSEVFTSQPGIAKTCLWQKPLLNGRNKGTKPIRLVEGGFVDPETGARRFDTTFARPDQCKAVMKAKVPMSILERHLKLGDLFKGFFIWLSEFNIEECGISVRLGRPFRKRRLPRSTALLEMPYLDPPSVEWNTDEPLQVQDPFIVDRNTAAAVNSETLQRIMHECCRARVMLEETVDKTSTILSDLLVDYEHEELIQKQETLVQSLDSTSRAVVIQQSPAPRTRPPRSRKPRAKGNGRQQEK